MKLYCLSGNPNRPCFLLKFKQVTIMLDCGLDVTTMLNFLPLPVVNSNCFSKLPGWTPSFNLPGGVKLADELRDVTGKIFVDSEPEFCLPELSMVDLSEVDILLISNYHCMLALPYIACYSNFKGDIYTTEPTLHIGRLFMDELVSYIEAMPKPGRATKWKQKNILGFLPSPLCDAVHPLKWKQCYNKHDINHSLSKVKLIGFGEQTSIMGVINICAYSSGFCLGSANWVLESDYEKMVYVSGSSNLTTHPKPMEQHPLKNANIMIISRLTQTPACNPDAMIGEFCMSSANTLKAGGNVLVPCYPSGVTYDLFECLSHHLDYLGINSVQMYFISPVADSSLAYSNIYSEWLSSDKASKVFKPEPPFPHADLVSAQRLRHYSNIHNIPPDIKQPCVVFTGHPSLRVGDVVHFIDLWGKSNLNTLIITEPDFPYQEALAPYQPLSMKVSYCPIDTSLSFSQTTKLIRDLKPDHLVINEQYITPPLITATSKDVNVASMIIEYDPPPITYGHASVLTLPIKRKLEKIKICDGLASTISPIEVKPGVSFATITGEIVNKDYQYSLNLNSSMKRDNDGLLFPNSYLIGTLDVHAFVAELETLGISDSKVQEIQGGHIVHLPKEDTILRIEDGSTHILSRDNEDLRIKLKDALLKCLSKF